MQQIRHVLTTQLLHAGNNSLNAFQQGRDSLFAGSVEDEICLVIALRRRQVEHRDRATVLLDGFRIRCGGMDLREKLVRPIPWIESGVYRTRELVPTTIRTSTLVRMRVISPWPSGISPNHTIPGRSSPPQRPYLPLHQLKAVLEQMQTTYLFDPDHSGPPHRGSCSTAIVSSPFFALSITA